MKDDFVELRKLGFGRLCSFLLCFVYAARKDKAGLKDFIYAMRWLSQ